MNEQTYYTRVTGTTFENRQMQLWRLTEGDRVFLVREPDNPYDKNAIMVEHSQAGRIGYIPAGLAEQIAPQLDSLGGITEATIVELVRGTESYPYKGVRISFTLILESFDSANSADSLLRSHGKICLGKSRSFFAEVSGNEELLIIVHYWNEIRFEIWQCSPLKKLSDIQAGDSHDKFVCMAVSHAGERVSILELDKDRITTRIQIWNPWNGEVIATVDGPKLRSEWSSIGQCDIEFAQANDILIVALVEYQREGVTCNDTDPIECLIAGWRTDSWGKVVDGSKRVIPITTDSPLDFDQHAFCPLILDANCRTVLFRVVSTTLGDKSFLQWLDIESMSICKEAEILGRINRVIKAGRDLIVACGDLWGFIIDPNRLEVIDRFVTPSHSSVQAVFPDSGILLYHTFTGNEHVALSILHVHDYGGGIYGRSMIARYLEERVDWNVACSSSSTRTIVVREYNGWSDKPDYLTVIGFHGSAFHNEQAGKPMAVEERNRIPRNDETMAVSQSIYLRDLLDEFIEAEGENCPRNEQMWVIVRQATNLENEWREAMLCGHTIKDLWGLNSDVVSEVQATDIYNCLCDAGNMFDEDYHPIFRFKRGDRYGHLDMPFVAFKRLYKTIPASVKTAIHMAIRQYNPDWDSFETALTQHLTEQYSLKKHRA